MGELDKLSHFLAKLLRHEAKSREIYVTEDEPKWSRVANKRELQEGYVAIDDVLSQPEARSYKESHVHTVVDNDRKGRFKTRIHEGVSQIKATQAHTMKLRSAEAEMTPINHHSDARVVLHGTKKANWPSIKANGLSRKTRNHIHFAEGENEQSGFPPNCDIVIEINLESALKDGLKFYRSENGVILCAGNHAGVIPARHFKKAYVLRTHESID